MSLHDERSSVEVGLRFERFNLRGSEEVQERFGRGLGEVWERFGRGLG